MKNNFLPIGFKIKTKNIKNESEDKMMKNIDKVLRSKAKSLKEKIIEVECPFEYNLKGYGKEGCELYKIEGKCEECWDKEINESEE